MIPVPSAAGFNKTCSAPKGRALRGMVPALDRHLDQVFLGLLDSLEMATGTSAAFPLPTPTYPVADDQGAKLKRFPPFHNLCDAVDRTTTLSFGLNSSGFTRTTSFSFGVVSCATDEQRTAAFWTYVSP